MSFEREFEALDSCGKADAPRKHPALLSIQFDPEKAPRMCPSTLTRQDGETWGDFGDDVIFAFVKFPQITLQSTIPTLLEHMSLVGHVCRLSPHGTSEYSCRNSSHDQGNRTDTDNSNLETCVTA